MKTCVGLFIFIIVYTNLGKWTAEEGISGGFRGNLGGFGGYLRGF